ncbi:caspase family protein [Caldovatus aquaticus]|uniref:Caspase family protein n=1 Tax=Caldovatus aquaticus TaxID=2865671 RepID=A0ABS7F027_9PROT|nr:caspase family protein [Caldovatus aquaticus]MBW8268944.1 caspase family protein [Caldovatus aquaticus]
MPGTRPGEAPRRAGAAQARPSRSGSAALTRRGCLALPGLLLAGGSASAPRAQPLPGPAASPSPPPQPFLRVEAGAHTAPVARLATDAAGRLLASVSDDKTLRLWSLPEGTPRAVLRPPIGPEAEGELYAVALSPDGARAFAGGFTARAWDGAFAIYVFDTGSGRLAARLGGLPAPVAHLAVAPDGSRFAAALGGRAGVKVWDARSGRLLFEDTAYGAPARMVAFAPGGRLAASAADGRVRIYDAEGRKLAERAPLPGARPFGIAWSPDGTLLAVGFEDRLRVEILAAADLRAVLAPDVAGLQGEGLPAVAWATDGRGGVQLHAAGYARRGGDGVAGTRGVAAPRDGQAPPAEAGRQQFVVRRWADFGLGPARDIPAARDAIAHLLALPQGGLAFAAADPGWGRIAPDGALALAPRPPVGDFRSTGAALAASPDALRVRFRLRADAPALVFDAGWGRLESAPADAAGFVAARTESARLPLADWRNANRPRLGATALPLGAGEFVRSAAISAGDEVILLGTDNHLRLFDAAGRLLDAAPTSGAVWGLTIVGTVAVAAQGDGTLRWYDLAGGQIAERAALFVHADGRRWVLWTPEGLFDHAPEGGQELVGVHLNNGRAQTPEWASFAQAYRALYAPAAVRARLAGDAAPARARLAALGEVRARIGRAPVLRGAAACAVTAEGACLPLAWDATVLPAEATALRLSFVAEDRGLGLGPLDVMVNDRIAVRATPGAGPTEVEVPLDPGPNRIVTRLYAEDRTLFAEGPALALRRPSDPEPPPGAGRLVVVAVGVDRYADPRLNLRFAVADARSVAETLQASARGLFRDVSLTLLADAEATREGVLAALARAAETVRAEDTFVLYLAGHGVLTDTDRRFLFLPADVGDASDWEALRRAALDEDTLIAALARVRARDGFLFIDTCYAGQVAVDALAAVGNETGRFLLAASTSVQEALDSYDDRNGVFAYAVREGLRGRAAVDAEGRVSALALGEWVTRRVPQLAAEKRHRQNAVFRTAQRDLRSFPLALVAR